MVDRRERLDDGEEGLRAALDGRQAAMWTAMPGIVQSFDGAKQTCTVQPAIQGRRTLQDNSIQLINMPLLLDCPVHFPRGGGAVLTFPVAAGDECLVVFSSRCIDAWWQSGGVQAPASQRMHDLSDGFAIVGFSSVPNAILDLSTTTTQLRSEDGETVIDLDPDGQIVTLTAPGGIVINGDVTINGDFTATGDGSAEGVSLKTHTHGGVTAGSDDTGEPN